MKKLWTKSDYAESELKIKHGSDMDPCGWPANWRAASPLFLLLLSLVEMACGMERHGCLCTRGEYRKQPGYGSLRVASQLTCSAVSLFIPSLYSGDGTLLTRGRGMVKAEHGPDMDPCGWPSNWRAAPPLYLFLLSIVEWHAVNTWPRTARIWISVCVCVWPAGKSAEMVLPPWVETWKKKTHRRQCKISSS